MQTDKVSAKGHVKVWKNGRLVAEGRNLVVNTGYAQMAARLVGTSVGVPSHMAIGTSGTLQTATQTALVGSQIERVAATVGASGRTVTIEASFGSGVSGSQSVREFGIFNASSNGVMLSRFTCQEFVITSSDTVDVTWEIVFGGD